MEMPEALRAELTKMRRDPAYFTISKMQCCTFCSEAKGVTTAYELLDGTGEVCGSWCSRHGWLSFNSTKNPPTERLTRSEVADANLRALRQQRLKVRRGTKKEETVV